jgi:ribosomal protein L24
MIIVGDVVVIDKGHYKGRPATVRSIRRDNYTLTLNDTPGPEDVTIRNVKRDEFHKKP